MVPSVTAAAKAINLASTVFTAGLATAKALKNYGPKVVTVGIAAHKQIGQLAATVDDRVVGKSETDDSQENLPYSLPPKIVRKLQLLTEIAENMEDAQTQSMIDDLMNHIRSDLLQILFVGRYSTGKSTLLNALIDRRLLPEGDQPTTKSLTWLLHGTDDEAFYQRCDGSVVPLALAALRNGELEATPDFVTNIFAFSTADILSHGVALVDSAGISSIDAIGESATMAAIAQSDAVVLVIDPYDLAEDRRKLVEYLHEHGHGDKLFVVMNKMDDVPPEERDEVVKSFYDFFTTQHVTARLIPLSALDESICNGGLKKLREELLEYMRRGVSQARCRTMETRVNKITAYLKQSCRERAELIGLDENARQKARNGIIRERQQKEQVIRRFCEHNQRELDCQGSIIKTNWNLFLNRAQTCGNRRAFRGVRGFGHKFQRTRPENSHTDRYARPTGPPRSHAPETPG